MHLPLHLLVHLPLHLLVHLLQDDGRVQIESFSAEKNEEVRQAIMKIAEEATSVGGGGGGRGRRGEKREGEAGAEAVPLGPPPEVGIIYRECEIKGVHNFGVFVEVLPGHEGLVHVSELDVKRIPSPEQGGFALGQKIDVKFLGKNDKGQNRFSRRAVMLRDSPNPAAGRSTGVESVAVAPNPISMAAEAAYAAPSPAPAPST